MEIIFYKDIHEFASQVEILLCQDEAKYNLMLGIINQLKQEKIPNQPFMCTVGDYHGVSGIFIQTPPRNLLGALLVEDEQVLRFAIKEFTKRNIKFPGITGEKKMADIFTAEWKKVNGIDASVAMNQGIYKLTKLHDIVLAPGRLKLASKEHLDLICEWIWDFSKSIPDVLTYEECEKMAYKHIENKTLYIWVDNHHIVSMVNAGRKTKNGSIISLVYTPEHYRGNGYASSAVYQLSKQLLETQQFCALYTDLQNPTSNSIYQKIGYKWVCESIMYEFGIDSKGKLVLPNRN